MGYYVRGHGELTIKSSNVEQAYRALCGLNDHDDLKHGGRWGGEGVSQSDPRPLGMSYHPARWFSWMDANYPDTTTDLFSLLGMLGYDYMVADEDDDILVITLSYDNKIGQAGLFMDALAPFVISGSIEWSGEDDAHWREVFSDGTLIRQTGSIVYE